MAKLIIRAATDRPAQVIELKPGVNRFGRSSENDHVLADQEISDRHCDILVDNDFVFVRDLNSTNGTFIDGDGVRESALYCGQVLRIGPVEMVLDAPPINISIPELPKPEASEVPVAPPPLDDGYPACLTHASRHAVWECSHCAKVYCDECIRKLRRVGGTHLKLCPSCSNPCLLTAWSEMMRKKKKGFFSSLASKISDGIKRTTRPLSR
jgi:hypothetical protein